MSFYKEFEPVWESLFNHKPKKEQTKKNKTQVASDLEQVTSNVVKEVEKHKGFMAGPEKQKEAYKAMLASLMMLVQVEGPIDDIIKEALRPHLNKMIDWIVDSLNEKGELKPDE